KDKWCCSIGEHRKIGGSQQALNASDDKILRADVIHGERQELRPRADATECQSIFEIERNGGRRRLDEGKDTASEGCGAQLAVVIGQIENRCARKVDVVEDGPIRASVDGSEYAEVGTRVDDSGYVVAIKGHGVEREVERR